MMKIHWIQAIAVLAAVTVAVGPAVGQKEEDRDPPPPKEEAKPSPAEKQETKKELKQSIRRTEKKAPERAEANQSDFEAEMRRLLKEVDDLDAASAARRRDLERRMNELRQRRERERVEQQLKPEEARRYAQWFLGGAAEPQWFIGIHVTEHEHHGDQAGVHVRDVTGNSPAKKAGLREGDVIVACNGIKLRDREALVHIIQAARDQPLELKVRRTDGETVEVTVRAEKRERIEGAPQLPYRQFQDQQMWRRSAPGSPDRSGPRQTEEIERLRKEMEEVKEALKRLHGELQKRRKD